MYTKFSISMSETREEISAHVVTLRVWAFLREERTLVVGLILIGVWMRLFHLALVDLSVPFGYGGLFAEFAEQIVERGYALPTRIDFYTDGGIPFAYPPLAFYFEAFLIDILSLPKFQVATMLPLVFAIAALPLFYMLTEELGLRLRTRLIALLSFSTFPPLLVQQIEAAGLAESLGTLAIVGLALALVRAYKQGTVSSYLIAGLALAASVLASPGSAYASTLTVVLFALVLIVSHTKHILWVTGRLTTLLGTGLVVSSPYWLTVIARHGSGVFLDPFIAEHASLLGSLYAVLLNFVHFEVFQVSGSKFNTGTFPLLSDSILLVGALWALFHRHIPLLVWFVIIFHIPRESSWLIATPAALLIGFGASEVLIPLLANLSRKRFPRTQRLISNGIIAILLISYALLMPTLTVKALVRNHSGLSQASIAAMEWAKQNTPHDATFVVMSRDQVLEWMPNLARRTVVNTPYGAEWEPEERTQAKRLNRALDGCSDIGCVSQEIKRMTSYDEIYLYLDNARLVNLTKESDVSTDQVRLEVLFENSEATIGRLIASPGF